MNLNRFGSGVKFLQQVASATNNVRRWSSQQRTASLKANKNPHTSTSRESNKRTRNIP